MSAWAPAAHSPCTAWCVTISYLIVVSKCLTVSSWRVRSSFWLAVVRVRSHGSWSSKQLVTLQRVGELILARSFESIWSWWLELEATGHTASTVRM